jgi:hypothetical protein
MSYPCNDMSGCLFINVAMLILLFFCSVFGAVASAARIVRTHFSEPVFNYRTIGARGITTQNNLFRYRHRILSINCRLLLSVIKFTH